MLMIIPILLNIIMVVVLYILEKKTTFGKLNYWFKQLIFGALFGGVAIVGSELGWSFNDVIMNVRDSAPICAGLIFGWPAGIIAGAIGGGYRALSVLWGAGTYTVVACSISTFLAGLIGALLRKFMFDDKKPTVAYAVGITVVCEIIHMLMILLTNMNDANNTFIFVQNCTIPMVLSNVVSVGVSVLIISLLSKEKIKRKKGQEQIAQTFQRWLVICIVIAFCVTSIFTYNLQSILSEKETSFNITQTLSDVYKDITDRSDEKLLSIAYHVKSEYQSNPTVDLATLLQSQELDYEIAEINIVEPSGIISRSTFSEIVGFDMNSGPQASEFMILSNGTTQEFVQKYRQNDNGYYRKYAGVAIDNGRYIQVGYDYDQFKGDIDEFAIGATKNRHIGESGFVVICDENMNVVIDDGVYSGVALVDLGIDLENKTPNVIYTAGVNSLKNPSIKVPHLFAYEYTEGYYIVGTISEDEAMLMRDSSIYTIIFMQVIVFSALFLLLYFLIKKLVIDNIHKINGTLAKISSGNLNETVDVRTNVEFSSLSDDINTTVDTLKRYIKEAAEKIDKELAYAKAIQLSALPSVFPPFPDQTDIDVYAEMIAAKEVGGDFYDFYKLNDNTVAFLVADVSGKGIPASLFMMEAKTVIKGLAERNLPVNEIFTLANQKLCENNESGMFVTAWMGILDIPSGKLTFANAGHNPPLIKRNGKFEYLKSRAGFVLAGMEGVKYKLNELTLERGDRIFLYTDGVTEATNEENELYGEDRLLAFLNEQRDINSRELFRGLKENIDEFVGNAPQFDDITILLFDYFEKNSIIKSEKTFVAREENLHAVLDFVETELEKFKCMPKTSMAISVAVEEVFINVSHYAYGESEGDAIVCTAFEPLSRKITLVVRDKGVAFNPLAKPDPDITLSAEDRDIGGLGIFITKKTFDSVTYAYENGENVLTMTKTI